MPRAHRRLPVPPWLLIALVTALVVAVAVAGALAQRLHWAPGDRDRDRPGPLSPTTHADGRPASRCDQAAEAEGLVPMRVLDLPERAAWTTAPPAYGFDAVPQGFVPERVGYCVELDDDWAFASMLPTGKASDLGIPVNVGAITRQRALDLRVASSDAARVPAVEHGEGWLEMWPSAYSGRASRQVPAQWKGDRFPLDDGFDADDTPGGGEYGSFQVHTVDRARASARTVFAVNGWANRPALDVGIGERTEGNRDWTFAENAGQVRHRRIVFFARAATAVVERGPKPMQLYARDPKATSVGTVIAGRVADARATVALVTRRQGREQVTPLTLKQGRFEQQVTIPVGLSSTTFELRSTIDHDGGTVTRTVWRADDVLAGDALFVQGQSNAAAVAYQGSGREAESPFVRSYGTSHPQSSVSLADDQWHRAIADTGTNSGAVGQWAAQLAHRIVTEQKVPVAIINGAEGGRPVRFFQRSTEGAADADTNYGRAILRLRGASVQTKLAAVLWYQGEGDHDRAVDHTKGFRRLVSTWREDLDGAPIYVHQVRASPCDSDTAISLRDAQRRMRLSLDVRLLSTNGLNGVDGCHFAWQGGYRELGDWNHRALAADLYGGAKVASTPPDVTTASLDAKDPRVVWLALTTRDPLVVEPGVAQYFLIDGQPTVTAVAHENGRLRLTTAAPVGKRAEVRFIGHRSAGPWVRSELAPGVPGPGLLAFAGVRVA